MPMWVHRPALGNLGTPRDWSRWRHMYGGDEYGRAIPEEQVSDPRSMVSGKTAYWSDRIAIFTGSPAEKSAHHVGS